MGVVVNGDGRFQRSGLAGHSNSAGCWLRPQTLQNPVARSTAPPLLWLLESARYAPAPWWAPPPAWCPAGTVLSASWRLPPGGAAATACGTRDQAPPGEGRGGATEGRLTAKKGIESSAERSNSEQVNRRHLLPFCAADHRQCSCPSAPCRLRPRRLRASCAPPRSRTSATPFPPRLQAGPGCAHIESA